jgi:single-stranded-DNA-specific exonuclease
MEKHQIPPLIKKILTVRGFKTEEEMGKFLYSGISNLSEPFAIPGMLEGCNTLKKAILNKEKIFVYGDGDTDGICGVYLILRLLEAVSAEFSFRLMHRLDEDYEIEEDLINTIKDEGYSVLISVDCGVSSIGALKKARGVGIKCIVLDHHIGNPALLPEGHFYIDPCLKNDWPEGTENLSGAAIAFKFVEGMGFILPGIREKYFHDLIEIPCLSILADSMPLTGENRIFVREGLRRMSFTRIKGLEHLLSRQNLRLPLSQRDITMRVTPKLNSPGRLGKPEFSLNLLMEEDYARINELMDEIEKLDRMRYRIVTKEISNIGSEHTGNGFVISEDISPGICGVVASRLSGKYNRPYLVGNSSDNLVKGSIRAPKGYNLYKKLEPLSGYMESMGGHSNAMGFKCSAEHLGRIKKFWEDIDWQPEEFNDYYDCELSIDELTPELVNEINEYLEPYGKGNLQPVFLCRDVLVKNIVRTKNEERIFWVISRDKRMFESLLTDNMMSLPLGEEKIDILYTPYVRENNGLYRLYLKIYNYFPFSTPYPLPLGARNKR